MYPGNRNDLIRRPYIKARIDHPTFEKKLMSKPPEQQPLKVEPMQTSRSRST